MNQSQRSGTYRIVEQAATSSRLGAPLAGTSARSQRSAQKQCRARALAPTELGTLTARLEASLQRALVPWVERLTAAQQASLEQTMREALVIDPVALQLAEPRE